MVADSSCFLLTSSLLYFKISHTNMKDLSECLSPIVFDLLVEQPHFEHLMFKCWKFMSSLGAKIFFW